MLSAARALGTQECNSCAREQLGRTATTGELILLTAPSSDLSDLSDRSDLSDLSDWPNPLKR